MKYPRSVAFFALALGFLAFAPKNVFAVDLTGQVKFDARVRNGPTTVGTDTLRVLKKGTNIVILEEKNSWYRISYNDLTGWMAGWLVAPGGPVTAPPTTDGSTGTDTGSTALSGVYNANARVRSSPSLTAGTIIVYPRGTSVTILDSENGWYQIRHASGVTGWTATWLVNLTSTLPLPTAAPIPTPEHVGKVQPKPLGPSTYQGGSVPANLDLAALNQYWLDRVNMLRREKGLRELVLDQRWVDTASEYAAYAGTHDVAAHERPDGKTMHQWIDTKNLPFTVRGSVGGWRGNYFTENQSGGSSDGSFESVKQTLDRAMNFFLAEAADNGPHYRTIYHEDWNSVGLGFYFEDMGNGRYRVTCIFHYGSLVQ